MNVSTVKTYNNISVSELKEHLNIDSSDTSNDSLLQRLLKASVGIAEKFIGSDIAMTTGTTTDYCIYGSYYQIDAPVTIQSVSATTSTGTVSNITAYTVYNYNSYTLIKFDTGLDAEILNVVYTSGMSTVPEDLKLAIFIKCGEMFSVDRNGYATTSVRETKAFNRILSHYCNMIG